MSFLQAQTNNECLGTGACANLSTGDTNVVVGDSAGYNLTYAKFSTFLGMGAGFSTTSANENTFVGALSGFSNGSGTDNTFIGFRSGYSNTLAADNTFIGSEAGMNNTSGYDNTFIGEESGQENITGHDNTFVGEDAGYSNTDGDDNTFIGSAAGRMNSTGHQNTFVGNEAGWDNTTGHHNTALGDSAGIDIGTGIDNTMIGAGAGASTEYGSGNTFVGKFAGRDNNRTNETYNALYNTALGAYAGETPRESNYSLYLGYNADASYSYNSSHSIIIGANASVNSTSSVRKHSTVIGIGAVADCSNCMILGGDADSNYVSVGVGTRAPNNQASLDLSDTTRGFLMNRMTTTQLSAFALDSADKGMMVVDTTANRLLFWDGGQWLVSGEQSLRTSGDSLYISEVSDGIDLSPYLDNTDAQDLSMSGDSLLIANGLGVDLSPYLDNTDSQDLSFSGDSLLISGGSGVDFAPYLDNTDAQDLNLNGSTLEISNGASADLSGFLDNTDSQDLSFSGDSLLISGGAGVDFTPYLDNTDNQTLTSATLNGSVLEIAIENGNSVSVELAPVLADHESRITTLESENATLSAQNEDYASRISSLETQILNIMEILDAPVKTLSPSLEQIPIMSIRAVNADIFKISYYVPEGTNNAALVVYNGEGAEVSRFEVYQYGRAQLDADLQNLANGAYKLVLEIDGENAQQQGVQILR
jgi:hypothetical protein